MTKPDPSAFDSAAKDYDNQFTFSSIGRLQRKRVYQILEQFDFFASPKKVFEVNCGTGHDALFFARKGHILTATDASAEMIKIARKKADHQDKINFYELDFSQLIDDLNFRNSDVLFSNFGGLNCLAPDDLKQFLTQIASVQTKGNQLILGLMPKKCFMEQLYFFLKVKWRQINRRNKDKAVQVSLNGKSMDTYYYSPTEIIDYLGKNYHLLCLKPIAFFLPPSYMESFFANKQKLLNFMFWMEKNMGLHHRFAAYADHYLLIAERQ